MLVERDPSFASFLERRSGSVETLVKPVNGMGLLTCLLRLKKEAASKFSTESTDV